MKHYAGFLVFFLSAWSLQAADVWDPKPATGPETNQWRRLVMYGDNWGRKQTVAHGGAAFKFRRGANEYVGDPAPVEIDHLDVDFYDADGDGGTNDGYMAYLEFSESNILGMAKWPTTGFYPGAMNRDFYGGIAWNVSDATFTGGGFSLEEGINSDHEGMFPQSAEDHPFQAQPYSANPNSRIKAHWSVVWSKADFLNGGDGGTVSIGSDSRMVVFWDRYWAGVDVVRFIIKDSGQYYAHDKAFTFIDGDPKVRDTLKQRFELNPTNVLWAPYNPSGHTFRLETNQTFSVSATTFTNVEAAGFYIAKDSPRRGMLHTKWYVFEFDADVTDNFRPGEHIEMAAVPGSGGVPDFYMSNCEVPYKLWNEIYKFGSSPAWATEARYVFNKDGDMGSMQFGTHSHAKSEPVVNFTIYDMAAWCNALSEKEALEPVFYADAEFTQIFKYTNIATRANRSYATAHFTNPVYTIVADSPLYVKWAADGYRVPTPDEWEQAYAVGNQSFGDAYAWVDTNALGQTQPVGTKATNDLGIYDMVGNVWEFTWIHGDVYVPGASNSQMAVGGGFHYPNDPRTAANSASPYGDHPFEGRYDIGLRLVRRDAGLSTPSIGTVPAGADGYDAAGVHKWKFSDVYQTTSAAVPPVTTNILSLVSIPEATSNNPFYRKNLNEWRETWIHAFEMSDTEISYEKWLKVYFWGLENGYEFDIGGAMGSMRWWDFTHTPDEPVTAIPWHDMLVWCNALSAMEGLDPVYYTDDALSNEYKKAFKSRARKLDLTNQMYDTTYAKADAREPWLFANWANDGFRLPTHAEWEYAARGGLDKEAFQWVGTDAEYTNYIWDLRNAGGTTHPVGLLQTNGYGLYDMQGNVAEAMWGTLLASQPDRPAIEEINNPKNGRYSGWQLDKNVNAPRLYPHSVGGSFFWSLNVVVADANMKQKMSGNHNASDVGFRVVKCVADAHPTNGVEELVPIVLMTIDTNTFDNLQGRCSQGNLSRNGQYLDAGVSSNVVIKWTADVGGAVLSSPVAVDGAVYVGGDDGFYALDATTGTQLWKIAISEGVDSSACVVDGVVYFGALDAKIYAIYTNGVEKWAVWSYQGEKTWLSQPIYSAPAVAYDTVFISMGGDKTGAIQGYSIVDGSNTVAGESVEFIDLYNRAAISMNSEYFFWGQAAAKTVLSGNIANGRLAGGGNGLGSYCRSSAVVDGDRIYVPFAGGVFEGGDSDYAAFKVSSITNGMDYVYEKFTEEDLINSERSGCFSSAAIWSNRFLIGLDSGRIENYALADGAVQSNYFTAGGAVRSPLTVSAADNMVYFGSYDDKIYGLDAATGTKKWDLKTGGNVNSAVCVENGNLFVRSDDGLLYCLEEAGALEIVAHPPIISVPEDGTSFCYVRLSMQPAVTTTVSVVWHAGDSNITVEAGSSSFVFTPENWNTYQAVTLAAAEDDDAIDSDAILQCTATGLPELYITATEADNDQKILVSADSVTVPENGTVTFKVKMNATLGLPSTVEVTHDSGDESIRITSDNSLDFSIENYNVWQTVTLVADDDEDLLHSEATIQCSTDGLAPVYVTATEFDDDAPLDIEVFSAIPDNSNSVIVLFNEPLDLTTAGTASNYALNLGASVLSATYNTNIPLQVSLVTTPLTERLEYTLTINGVEDEPNTEVLSNAQLSVIYYTYRTYLFDFGTVADITPGNWNNLTDISTGVHISNAISSTGAVSGISLEITGEFLNNAGEGVSSTELYPLTASMDNFIVVDTNPATFKLSGLDTNTFYEMDFYGSRILTKRAVIFTVGSNSIALDNSFNSNTVASLLNLIPEPDGTLSVTAAADSENNAVYGYLGVLELRTPVLPAAPILETSVSALTVPEGGTNTFGVRFASVLDLAKTVSVMRVSGDLDLTPTEGTNLVFTTSDWMLYQTVTLTAAPDSDRVNSSAVIRCSASGVSNVYVTATEADSEAYLNHALPWSEPFEALTQGPLGGQHGWVAGAGAIVTNTVAQAGSQSLSLSEATATHTFDGAPTNIWITLWAKPVTGTEPAPIPADASAVFYVNTNGNLVAYSNTTAITLGTTVSNGWNKFGIECDYVSKVWKLELNNIPMFGNFAFYGNPAGFSALELPSPSASTCFIDSIYLTDQSDPSDSDSDGLPDAWEQLYFGDLSPNPGDSASNGTYTVYQAYIAGIDPTDSLAQFVVDDLQSNILFWNGVSGRVYTVYWTSNLLSGFQTLETNVLWTGSIFTDSTHSAEQKGFYKIEVELEK